MLALTLFAALSIGAAAAHPPQPPPAPPPTPAACRPNPAGRVDYQACADAAAPGSPERALALINLGSLAMQRGDNAAALKLFDEADPPGGASKVYSDALFHAQRAALMDHAGRAAEAIDNARTALKMMSGNPWPTVAAAEALKNRDPAVIYPLILPVLRKAGGADYDHALAAYRATPADDWVALSNQAGVLDELDDHAGARTAAERALKLAPDQPAVLNNACYVIARAGDPATALPYCRRVAAEQPRVAAVHDSYAAALADLGRCAQAQAELDEARTLDPTAVEYQRKLVCGGGEGPSPGVPRATSGVRSYRQAHEAGMAASTDITRRRRAAIGSIRSGI